MALLVIATGAVACTGDGSTPRATPEASSSPDDETSVSPPDKEGTGGHEIEAPAGFILTPTRALRRCPQPPPLSGECPAIIPAASDHVLVESFGKPGGHFQVLELTAGAPRKDPAANAPPHLVHVVVEAGDARHLIDFGDPTGSGPLQDSLLEARRDAPVGLGHRTWGGVTGELMLAPSFPGGGAHGDHLVFRWRRGKVIHNVSLHAWVPVAEAESTLRKMVVSIR